MARQFNGTSDYLTRIPFTPGGGSLSVAAWVNSATTTVGLRTIYADRSTTSILPSRFVLDQNGSTFHVLVRDDSGSTAEVVAGTTVAGKWQHVVGVYEATTKSIALYLDGSRVGSPFTNSAITGIFTTDSVNVGARISGTAVRNSYWNGSIGPVAVWSSALMDNDIKALAKGTPPPLIQSNALVSFWPIDGLNQREERDQIGGKDLSVIGSTWAQGPPIFNPNSPVPHLMLAPSCIHDRPPGLHRVGRDAAPPLWQEPRLLLNVGPVVSARKLARWYPGLSHRRRASGSA